MNSIVAIVGRPNVGKSTLFNRLTESREAIVDPTSGVTRDRKYGRVTWTGREFSVIDTGGYSTNSDDSFESEIRDQVLISIEEADLILFMVDVQDGITDLDREIANLLRRNSKDIILVSNKVDTGEREFQSAEFYGLGIADEIISISANNGYGTGDLLDEIVKILPENEESELDESIAKIAVVGEPNVGKSSFVNTLLEEERNIVTDIAGTTRDALHTHFKAFGFDFILIDTAGLRKRSKLEDNIEFYSTVRTMRAVDESDVCLLLIDAEKGFTKHDLQIFYDIADRNKGIVMLINKWDLIEKDTKTVDQLTAKIRERIAPFTDIPIMFTSNIKKQRILKALEKALEVNENRKRKIPTSKLNDALQEIVGSNPPPSHKGKHIKIKYMMQLPTPYPAFAFYCNLPQYIKDPYKRFLENKIRENFDFHGVPIRIFFRKK